MSGCRVIVGLGNPGVQYENTPHSVGFEVLDLLCSRAGALWEEKRQYKCLLARVESRGKKLLLVKPLTFMNLSGECVCSVVKYHNAVASETVVVQDDIDLSTGRLRIRKGGSCGGHNGIRNIIERMGTGDFIRVKIGVGRSRAEKGVVEHVLGKFDPQSRSLIDEAVAEAARAVNLILEEGVDTAMNRCNNFKPSSQESAIKSGK